MSPEVFVSYTHDSDQHKQNVIALVSDLRMNGINARLDQEVNGTPEVGWPAWMEERIRESSFVLVVCTETYKRRYELNERPGVGKGGTWEGGIIRQELYDGQGKNEKFAAVVFSESDKEHIPGPLRPHTHYVYPRDNGALIRWLTDQPAYLPPPLGKIPKLPPNP